MLKAARGPVVGTLSGGRGIRLTPVRPTVPALATLGTLTPGSTRGLDDVTLAEIGRHIRCTDAVSQHIITHSNTQLELVDIKGISSSTGKSVRG